MMVAGKSVAGSAGFCELLVSCPDGVLVGRFALDASRLAWATIVSAWSNDRDLFWGSEVALCGLKIEQLKITAAEAAMASNGLNWIFRIL